MIVRFRRGNMTETRPVHGKLGHHVSAARKRDGYKQLPVSVKFTKYGNTLFRPVTSRPFSPSRLPLRAHFHRERDVWVPGRQTHEKSDVE